MKKSSFIATLLCIVILMNFVSCSDGHDYDENWIIGKSSTEVVEQYGAFDCELMPADGVYRNCKCGYTIKEAQTGFLGTSQEELLFIYFDENGIAYQCEEGYRPA